MRALILVDIQNDFLPGGALAVPDGDAVIAVANRLKPGFELVIATQDWHPADHGSFAANFPANDAEPGQIVDLDGLQQILWPTHCVQNTPGAEFAKGLDLDGVVVFQKGSDPRVDSYSGFFDNGHRHSTGLGDYLKEQGVTDVFVCGLATDYCVNFTAKDALELGFTTYLVEDGCRGVNLSPDDSTQALKGLKEAGAHVVRSEDV